MTCIICHGEQVEMTDVREEVWSGNDVVYVPIRVPVCQSCGERYYDRQTIRRLEEFEQKVREGSAELEEIGKVLISR